MKWSGTEEEGQDAGDKRVEEWETCADNRDVCFEGGPDGCFLVCFCIIVAVDHVCQLVESGGTDGDDDDADAEDEHDTCSFAFGEFELG